MDAQPLHRGAGAPRLMKASELRSVWGNPFALCLPVDGTTWSSPARSVGMAVLHEMLMKPYQQLSATLPPRVGEH